MMSPRDRDLGHIIENMERAKGECHFSAVALTAGDPELKGLLALAELAIQQVIHAANAKRQDQS